MVLENGDSTLLWGRDVAKDLTNYVVLDYCQYGTQYRKRTRIAHSENLHWVPRALCNAKTCSQCVDGKHILTAQRGPGPGSKGCARRPEDIASLDTLHALPSALTEEIYTLCRRHIWELI